ncbi:hypothetical protein K438DRAFT_1753929 [Mycena galopus ATCC 62051]|nr:hypothetical protein K438DRAFT_1753929 [Mycena galopus ATCC 62051]
MCTCGQARPHYNGTTGRAPRGHITADDLGTGNADIGGNVANGGDAGLFERHVQFGQWIGGTWVLEPYPFEAINITYSQSMQWIHSHGVAPQSADAMELHAFATSWRNLEEGLSDPRGQQFTGHDIENAESVLRWDIGRVTSWATLWHGPLRPGVSSDSPRRPADTARHEEEPTPTVQGDAEMAPAGAEQEDGEVLVPGGPIVGPEALEGGSHDEGTPKGNARP